MSGKNLTRVIIEYCENNLKLYDAIALRGLFAKNLIKKVIFE